MPNEPSTSESDASERIRFVQEHFAYVWRLLRRMGLSPADADDASQETFLVGRRKRDQIEPGRERAFLYRCALNKVAQFRQLEPYEPRDGSFTMLANSKTTGFRHDSIAAGKVMLQKIADEWDFDVVFTETNEDFTVEGLSQFEIVFFLNTTGDVLNDEEQSAYETWMTEHNGAFAGTHSATDTENGWAFYSEVTG